VYYYTCEGPNLVALLSSFQQDVFLFSLFLFKLLDVITLFTLVLLRPLGGVIFGVLVWLISITLFYPLSFRDERGSNFYLDWDCIFNRSSDFCRCNRPDDVDSCSDALIHKASIAFKIKTSERQFSWSERASIRYGNCVHQINRPDNHSLGPDVRSLGMEITCSGSTNVQMIGQHHPNAAQIRKKILQNFGKQIAQLSVRTAPRFYQARCSFEPAGYK
jgi:hypothetical protein